MENVSIIILLIIVYLLNKKSKEGFQQTTFTPGMIIAWNGTTAPRGWALCDGNDGRPDLRGRFILGYNPNSNNYTVNTIGKVDGEEQHTLTIGEMPVHNHQTHILDNNNSCTCGGGRCACDINWSAVTKNTGYSQPHNNMPTYYVLAYIMKTN